MLSIYLLERMFNTINNALKTKTISSNDWSNRLLQSDLHPEIILSPTLARYIDELGRARKDQLQDAAVALSKLITESQAILHLGKNSKDNRVNTLSILLAEQLAKYACNVAVIFAKKKIEVPQNIQELAQSQTQKKEVSQPALKAMETKNDDLDINLFPLLNKVIKGLQNGSSILAVKSSNGSSYTFTGSSTLYAYLCMRLKEETHLDSIPWEYIKRFIQPKDYKLQTLKTKASQYSSGSCKLPRGYEQINIIVKNAK